MADTTQERNVIITSYPKEMVHGMYRNAEMIAVRNYFMGKE